MRQRLTSDALVAMEIISAMQPKEIVLKWIEAFNRADVHSMIALYAADAVNHQVVNEPVAGRKAIQQMFEQEFSQAEMVCIPEQIFQDGEWAILEWKDPKGLRGCGFFHIVNDQIIFQRGYWDKLSFLKLN
jgi:limonene-1,2-epoxide hydrolase